MRVGHSAQHTYYGTVANIFTSDFQNLFVLNVPDTEGQ